jgi:hypothetical protein
MLPRDLCLSKAEECELKAAEQDAASAADWLLMAEDWRAAAEMGVERPPIAHQPKPGNW